MININDPVVRLVLGVVAAGVVILLITLIPYGLVVLVVLVGVIYYLFTRNKRS